MTEDLFASGNRLELIPIVGAEVYYLRHLELHQHPDALLGKLIDETPWRAEKVTLWGKTFEQPRLIAWFGDENGIYVYSGINLQPLPWTDILLSIKEKVEAATGISFNSVLINYYRDNRDSMGFHCDDEPELGRRPIIASVSLGEERTLIFKHKTNKSMKPVRLKLPSGSLLLMQGDTQQNWKHGINKEPVFCGPRVNLTFRRIHLQRGDDANSIKQRRS